MQLTGVTAIVRLDGSVRLVQESGTGRRLVRTAVRSQRRLRRRIGWKRDGERVLLRRYRRVTGTDLDLRNPRRFVDHLYVRMITQHRRPAPVFTVLTDKYLVREYVRATVGERHLTPLLWHGTDPTEIPFDRLPAQFVVKSNHACGQVMRVEGDVDRVAVMSTASAWMSVNYYWAMREIQYRRIVPRVLVEERLDDCFEAGPLDYRYYCFGGVPALIQVSDHRHGVHLFFDPQWERVAARYRPERTTYEVPVPTNLSEMNEVAARLSAPFDFVRVDLYNVGGKVFFGELTFTPQAGTRVFEPEAIELDLGRRWRLAQVRLDASSDPKMGPGSVRA